MFKDSVYSVVRSPSAGREHISKIIDTSDDTDVLPELPLERRCPYHPPAGYRVLSEDGPLTKVKLYDGRSVWAATGYKAVRALLAHPDLSVDHSNPGIPLPAPGLARLRASRAVSVSALLRTDPPQHGRQRRAVMPALTVKRVDSLIPMVERIVEGELDRMVGVGPPTDLLSQFATPIVVRTLALVLGVPTLETEHFYRAATRRLGPIKPMADYLTSLLAGDRELLQEGILRSLIGRIDAGELTEDEAVQCALAVVIAGQDITSSTLALSVITLLEHPGHLQQLCADRHLWARAVDELLRFLSVTGGTARVATADIEFDGQLIRAGDGIVLLNPAANRDESQYRCPDELDFDRPRRDHLTFGFGIHQCVGKNVVRIELMAALRALFERIPTLRTTVPIERIRVKQGVVFGLAELPVTW